MGNGSGRFPGSLAVNPTKYTPAASETDKSIPWFMKFFAKSLSAILAFLAGVIITVSFTHIPTKKVDFNPGGYSESDVIRPGVCDLTAHPELYDKRVVTGLMPIRPPACPVPTFMIMTAQPKHVRVLSTFNAK